MRMSSIGWVVLGCALALAGCKSGDDDDDTAASGTGGAMAGTGPTAGMAATGTTAVATIAGFEGGTVTGSATFTQTGTDVTINVSLSNCPDGPHGVHIHQGTSCADAMMQGAHWDMTRGEGIPDVMCTGMAGTATVTRSATDPTLAWSIGGAAATNVVGHAFVVHSPGNPTPPRIGCGLIAMQ